VTAQKAALAERATAAARILETEGKAGENAGELPNFETFSARPEATTKPKSKSFKPKGQ
jgi:hypothetical protein